MTRITNTPAVSMEKLRCRMEITETGFRAYEFADDRSDDRENNRDIEPNKNVRQRVRHLNNLENMPF